MLRHFFRVTYHAPDACMRREMHLRPHPGISTRHFQIRNRYCKFVASRPGFSAPARRGEAFAISLDNDMKICDIGDVILIEPS